MMHVEALLTNLDGITSRKYDKISPLFEFLSNQFGIFVNLEYLSKSMTKSHPFLSSYLIAMCACGREVETTGHFLLRCHLYSSQRLELSENLEKADSSFLNLKVH